MAGAPTPEAPRSRFVTAVDDDGGARDPHAEGPVVQTRLAPGTVVTVTRRTPEPAVEVLASAGTALARSHRLALAEGLDVLHPPKVEAEARACLDASGLDDPSLDDLRELAFVTIDGPGTRDLDQALHVEPDGAGFLVRYALADAAYYVRPGSALFEEAVRRASSYYLPGLSVPMLPRVLSEGLISLEPGVDRRATVFEMHLDAAGRCQRTRLVRARIHSRQQLTFERVQDFLDHPESEGFDDPAVAGSLRGLRAVGELRLDDAAQRDVAIYRRAEIAVKIEGRDAMGFSIVAQPRNAVEHYSEQLSLLCNVEGARFLRDGDEDDDEVQPIYRVHAPPGPERIEGFEHMLARTVEQHRLEPGKWAWHRGSGVSLSRYLAGLPTTGPHQRIARAILRQAIMVNVRSVFRATAGPHHGIGADVYARFSAPMREAVGIFLHKEAWEKMTGTPGGPDDATLRERIITGANEAKLRQRALTHAANLAVLDEVFSRDVQIAPERRPRRTGTLMGVTRSKLYVQLDDPPLDVKVYARHLPEPWVADDGQATAKCGARVIRLGDLIPLTVAGRDDRGRWRLTPVLDRAVDSAAER